MHVRLTHRRRLSPRAVAATMTGLLVLSVAATGCTSAEQSSASSDKPDASSTPKKPSVTVSANVPEGAQDVAVDKIVEITVNHGALKRVQFTAQSTQTRLSGEIAGDAKTWTANERLEPGENYLVRTVALGADGAKVVTNQGFRSESLTLDQQTYPSIAPLAEETVGVGMPVIVQFDIAVANKAAIERQLSVTSSPKQAGAWHWISDNEVHFRPKTYWTPGTDVTVNADVNSIAAGNGIYGQESRTTSFHVGDSVVSKVDVAAHKMTVEVNGDVARTMSISAGKPGFITRSGTKVIIEKVRNKTMDAATIGISKDDPEYYNLEVEYALRVTYSGEFLHAAPWSAGSQGIANVSHGCVGMSMTDAAWLFNLTKRGDVVEVSGSDRYMTLENGYGDWNESFTDYKQGSALS